MANRKMKESRKCADFCKKYGPSSVMLRPNHHPTQNRLAVYAYSTRDDCAVDGKDLR
jgi:hypothetical protein